MCLSKTDVCCWSTVVRQVLGIFCKTTLILLMVFSLSMNIRSAGLPARND
jgi:hypothetical protein